LFRFDGVGEEFLAMGALAQTVDIITKSLSVRTAAKPMFVFRTLAAVRWISLRTATRHDTRIRFSVWAGFPSVASKTFAVISGEPSRAMARIPVREVSFSADL
jgi:hypothetical protein